MASKLPGYEPMLAAYHRAFAGELRGIVLALPIGPERGIMSADNHLGS
jgi:hypothetical protein